MRTYKEAEARYLSDPPFHRLVDHIASQALMWRYTRDDVMAAAVLALAHARDLPMPKFVSGEPGYEDMGK